MQSNLSDPSTRKGLFLTGCPRTGTTCLAKIIAEHGIDFGEAANGGRTGHNYEDVLFADRSELAINTSGGVWFMMPPLIVGKMHPTLFPEIMEKRFSPDSEVIALKDPRLCVTYPCWAGQLPDWPVVVSIRHPLEMAQSLMAMNMHPLQHGLGTWWRFYSDLLMYQRIYGFSIYWVDYPSLTGLDTALEAVGLELDPLKVAVIFDASKQHNKAEQPITEAPYLEEFYHWAVREAKGK